MPYRGDLKMVPDYINPQNLVPWMRWAWEYPPVTLFMFPQQMEYMRNAFIWMINTTSNLDDPSIASTGGPRGGTIC